MADELERRVRTVEEELNGEKYLTRYAVEQTQRSGEVLHALRSDVAAVRSDVATLRADVGAGTVRVDHLGGDMAAVKAALAMHGRALDVLQQDVRQLRSEVTDMNGKLDAVLAAVTPHDPAYLKRTATLRLIRPRRRGPPSGRHPGRAGLKASSMFRSTLRITWSSRRCSVMTSCSAR
jgi:hypothetical protein